MANRAFFQMLASLVERLTFIEFNFVVGASGAVGTVKGSGIKSITRVQQGVYMIQLQDSYNRYFGGACGLVEQPGTGVAITAASNNLTVGVLYTITVLGDATAADWVTVGVPAGLTPSVGLPFVALATGSGTGTTARVAPLAATGATDALVFNVAGDTNAVINQKAIHGTGGYVFMVCREGSNGAVVDPPQYSVVGGHMFLRNSSIKGKGE